MKKTTISTKDMLAQVACVTCVPMMLLTMYLVSFCI